MFIIAALIYNGFGVTVTKYTSATARGVMEQMRTISVWLFFLIKPGFGHEKFSFTKLGGFALIITGVLFFNKILQFDGCGIRFGSPDEAQEDAPSEDEHAEEQALDNSHDQEEAIPLKKADKADSVDVFQYQYAAESAN